MSTARVDIAGSLLAAAFTTAVLLLTTWGGSTYGWRSREILGLGAGTLACVVLFVIVERFAAPGKPRGLVVLARHFTYILSHENRAGRDRAPWAA